VMESKFGLLCCTKV
jgi:hypothetical protein